MSEPDMVNHPPHYGQHPLGIECIDVVEYFNFNLGNAIKYIWREGLKENSIQDLQKAVWYINREIARREAPLHVVRPDSANINTASDRRRLLPSDPGALAEEY
jgi:hypothetical protein